MADSEKSSGGKVRLILLGAALIAVLGYGYYWKFVPKTPEEKQAAAARKQAAEDKKAWEGIREAQEERTEEIREQYKEEFEKSKLPIVFTASERHPLPQAAKLLSALPEFPSEAAPVVFLAPFQSAAPDGKQTSTTRILNDLVRFQLRASPRDRLALNLVPQSTMQAPHRRAGVDDPLAQLRPEQFLEDARKLQCDFFGYGKADALPDGSMMLQLAFMDLKTSRTAVFNQSKPMNGLADLMKAGVAFAAEFCGLKADVAESAGMLRGFPKKAASLEFAAKDREDTITATDARAAFAADPDCPYLYETLYWKQLGDDMLPLIDEGLKRWPDDPRLLFLKSNHASPTVAALFQSELARRYPGMLALNGRFQTVAEQVIAKSIAPEATEFVQAGERYMAECIRRRPDDWLLLWQHAYYLNECAASQPYVEMIKSGKKPEAAEMERMTEEVGKVAGVARAEIAKAAELRPDCPSLQRDQLRYQAMEGNVSSADLIATARRISALDPKSVEADALAMRMVSDDPQLQASIAKESADRVAANGAPQTQLDAMIPLIDTMREAMKWNQKDQDLTVLTTHPAVQVYLATVEKFMEQPDAPPLWSGQIDTLWRIYQSRGDQAKLQRLTQYSQEVYKRTDAAHEAGEWQKCYDYANATWQAASSRRERQLYYVVKSLWKLKRYDESLQHAEQGIERFPKSPVFHYMFAVVALEANVRLNEAYEHAAFAAPLARDNSGLQNALKQLGEKLNRPTKV